MPPKLFKNCFYLLMSIIGLTAFGQAPVTIPYSQNFEGSTSEWTFQTSGTNKWVIGSGTNNGGTKAMYISNNGSTYAYTTSSNQFGTSATVNVDLSNVTAATLTFDWKCAGQPFLDYGQVRVNTGNGEDDIDLNNYIVHYNSPSFTTASYNLTPYVGGVIQLKFFWTNDISGGTQGPFAIDNVSIFSGSVPVVTNIPTYGNTYNHIITGGTVLNSGDYEVTARGIVYSTSSMPTLETGIIIPLGAGVGGFTTDILNLEDNGVYYVRSYATNERGTGYGDNFLIHLLNIPPPVAQSGKPLGMEGTGFKARWNHVPGAQEYRLDVSTLPQFSVEYFNEDFSGFIGGGGTGDLSQNLDMYMVNQDWTGTRVYNSPEYGLIGSAAGVGSITSPAINISSNSGNATLTLDLKRFNTTDNTAVQVFYAANGVNFVQLGNNITNLTDAFVTYTFAVTGGTASSKFKITAVAGTTERFFVDNVIVKHDYMLPDYNDLAVANTTSYKVTGLTAGTTYYYRVRSIGYNSTSTASNIIAMKAIRSNVWNGTVWSTGALPTLDEEAVIQGNYYTAPVTVPVLENELGTVMGNGAFSAGYLTINSNTLTVNPGTAVNVVEEITNNAQPDNFIVQNNGALIQTSNSVNTGGITVLRDTNQLFRMDYTFWSSPVAGQNLFAFSPATLNNRFYVYGTDGDSEEYMQVLESDNFEANGNSPYFTAGKAYLIRMPNELVEGMSGYPESVGAYDAAGYSMQFHGVFAGVPNNGAITLPFVNSGGYNGVGNPYPSPINVEQFFTANNSNIANGEGLYFWRKRNNAEATSFAVLSMDGYTANDGGAAEDSSNYTAGGQQWEDYYQNTPDSEWTIAAGQGFFVRAQQGSAGILFNNGMRTAPVSGQPFFRTGMDNQPEKSRMWFNLTNGNGFSQTTVVYNPLSTLGLDYGRDAKAFGAGGLMSLYTFADDQLLAIQSRPDFEDTDVVPMGFRADVAGSYTITLHRKEGVFAGAQNVYLKDKLTGIVHDIKSGSYTFTTEAGTFNDRFEVVYTLVVLETENPSLALNAVVVYKQGGVIRINSGNLNMQDITIFDIKGGVLYTREAINTTDFAASDFNVEQQVLLIQVVTESGTVTRKVVN